MNLFKLITVATLTLSTTACVTQSNMPLIFGQSQTVGLSMGGSATGEGVELTLGFKDRNIAIIPVTVKQGDGTSTLVKSSVPTEDPTDDESTQDAMSVLGQFELDAKGASAEVGLGKFFATGQAAKRLADGFATKMAKDD